MKHFLVIALFLCLVSCREEVRHMSIANEYFVEYLLTHNSTYLDSSYQSLKYGNYLNGNSLNSQNVDFIASLLLYMKKYDELESLLMATNTLDVRKKDFTLNLTRALKTFEDDSVLSKGYILDNLDMVNEEIAANSSDSTLWFDYFEMKVYINGKENTLTEIDSFKRVNNVFTDLFYEVILVDFVRDYPEALLFPKLEN